jgi:hypothetical protein
LPLKSFIFEMQMNKLIAAFDFFIRIQGTLLFENPSLSRGNAEGHQHENCPLFWSTTRDGKLHPT